MAPLLVLVVGFFSSPSEGFLPPVSNNAATSLPTVLPFSSSTTTSQSPFFSEEEMIQMAQSFTSNPSVEALADDFVFRGPVIGPLGKADFAATFKGVAGEGGLTAAFPDLEPNNFGFTVDPTEPNRVWYFSRPRGTFTGAFNHPVNGRIEPTGAKYVGPPEARSLIFDEEGKVKYQSVGYVTDRFTGDTTGGQGAVFGMYYVMGQAIDDTIGSFSTVLLQKLTDFLPEGMVPRSYSKRENIPKWWTDERLGAEK